MKATYSIPGLLWLFLVVIYPTTQAHAILKRATNDNGLYKFAERDGGCVEVDSIEPCPITWKLSATAAKFYKQQTRQTDTALKGLEMMSASDECKNAWKTTMCGQAAPKCSADGSQDYGDVATACPKIYSECPKNVSEMFKSRKLCEKVISGKIAKPTCVKPPKIEGSCPQPKYKVCCIIYRGVAMQRQARKDYSKDYTVNFWYHAVTTCGQHTPDAIWQRGAIFHSSNRNKSVYNTKLWQI